MDIPTCPARLFIFKEGKVEEVINKICGQLPEGFMINLCMENGAAWVELITPSGITKDIDGGCQTIIEQLNYALCIATGLIE